MAKKPMKMKAALKKFEKSGKDKKQDAAGAKALIKKAKKK